MNEDGSTPLPWKIYQKIGFRFVLIFFVLFITCLDWSVNPILSQLYYYGPLSSVLDGIVSWVGSGIFNIESTIVSPYDGEHNDRTYVYLLYFTIAIFAALGTILWSILDRKRSNYKVLYYWFTTIIRYYLAFTMFQFALYKFFRIQFPDLGFYTLTAQVGDLSPMHLAWAFFGHSYEYNVFMGVAEAATLLLLFRKTTALGTLLVMAALANVIAVNYSFDVHAKLYPTALFIMALFLFLRDAKSILRFFTSGRAVSLSKIQAPEFKKPWMNKAKPVLKLTIIGYFLIVPLIDNIDFRKSIVDDIEAKMEYSGLYEIESFILNNDTISVSDPMRWQQLIVGDDMLEAVRFQGDSVAYAKLKIDSKEILLYCDPTVLSRKTQEIYNELGIGDDVYYGMDSILIARKIISRYYIERPDSNTLEIKGIVNNDSLHIHAKRRPLNLKEFRLIKKRFHWINEASNFY